MEISTYEIRSRLDAGESKVNITKDLLDAGWGRYKIAKVFEIGENAARSLINKAKNQYSPVDDNVKKDSMKGVLLSFLRDKYQINTEEEAEEILKTNFSNCLIVRSMLSDGDIRYTPVANCSNEMKWLKNNRLKQFKYNRNEDYLYIQFDKNLPFDEIKIYFVSDVHVGSVFCDMERFKRDVDTIFEDPSAFVLWGGDLLEWIHKLSKGDITEQIMSPNAQAEMVARIAMKIAHKSIAYWEGNHDGGRGSHTNSNLAECVALLLKVPLFKMETVVDFDFGGKIFTALVEHGRGNGTSLQARVKEADKSREIMGFPIHYHINGHIHNYTRIEPYTVEKVTGIGKKYLRSYTIIGGSYMKYTGSYAQKMKLPPSPQDLPYLILRKDGTHGEGRIMVAPDQTIES